MSLLLFAAAAAAPPAELLAEQLTTDAYTYGVACSPAKVLYDQVLAGVQILEATGQVQDPEGVGELRAWLTPAEDRGLDFDGALVALGAEGEEAPQFLSVPFSGSPEQLVELLEGLAGDEVRSSAGGYVTKDGVPVERVDGSIQVRRTAGEGTPLPVGLLQDLGEDVGCAFIVGPGMLPPGEGMEAAALSAYLPFGSDGPFLARVSDLPLPESAWSLKAQPARYSGSSTVEPAWVMLVAADGLEMLTALPDRGDIGVKPPDADRLRRHLAIPPGATIALFGGQEDRKGVARVPITNSKGRPLKARKILGAMETLFVEGEYAFQGTADDGFVAVSADGWELHGRVSDGWLTLGDLESVVDEAHRGAGQAWGHPQGEALSAEWPLVLLPLTPPRFGVPVPATVGLRPRGQLLEIGVVGLGSEGNQFLVGALLGVAVPNFLQMRLRARRAEMEGHLYALATAELGYRAVHGRFLAVPPAPRSVAELTPLPVPWPVEESWAEVGWAPDDDLRSTLSIEVAEDGGSFTVHGWTDADGDGVPAHYTLTWTDGVLGEPISVTPHQVY